MRICVSILAFVLCAQVFSADPTPEAKAAFEAAYAAGGTAVAEKKWAVAAVKFEEALKAIGDADHANKAVAKVLLDKAKDMAKKQEGLHTADELLRLKQWAEAEAAYKKAAETLGESDEIKKGIAAAQAGAAAEKAGTAPAVAEKKEEPAPPKPAPAEVKPTPAETKPAEAKSTALEIPEPKAVSLEGRDKWRKGAGSQCYWAAERLYLEEGDEYYDKVLKGDFAASAVFEAQMDHRSAIKIELRPVKGAEGKKILGWGSKDGSAPYLAVEKDIRARGEKQPGKVLTLAFRRTGLKIEFFCDGKLIGHTFDAKEGQPYIFWVSGKGIMDGATVVEK
ncbi:MAG TPA: hypothetical protein VEJ63_12710 [Planctomycetota bacterium]|nr:hypothetical protein [Planctomycetota bacterium]